MIEEQRELKEGEVEDSVKKKMGDLGVDVESNGREVSATVDCFEDATLIQRMFSGTIIQRRRRK